MSSRWFVTALQGTLKLGRKGGENSGKTGEKQGKTGAYAFSYIFSFNTMYRSSFYIVLQG
jgi:hypothetical protein